MTQKQFPHFLAFSSQLQCLGLDKVYTEAFYAARRKKPSHAVSDLIPKRLCVGWAKDVLWNTVLQYVNVAWSDSLVGNSSSAVQSPSPISYCISQKQLRTGFWVSVTHSQIPVQEGVIWNITEMMIGSKMKLKKSEICTFIWTIQLKLAKPVACSGFSMFLQQKVLVTSVLVRLSDT